MAEIGESSYRRFLQGDKQTIEEWIRTYSDPLVRFAYSIVHSASAAEDIAAEAITDLYMRGKRFPDEARTRAYLYRMARSRSVDYLRHHRRQVPLEDIQNVLGTGDPEAGLLLRQRDESLYRCLQALPEQYRLVLQLHYLDGFTIPQICGILGKHSKQVYNLLSRARAALKPILEKEGITHEDI